MPGIWSRHRDEITIDRLQKFWNELPIQARNNLLRIDKQTLFEQARKNLYCSRCNGLLLESFTQIVMYGKSLQQHHEGSLVNSYMDQEDDVAQDPAVHPWGGLAATKDGLLTLLDCFIHSRSLTPLQTVFDSARAREREREMLYPDACGGEGRGWISQTGGGTGGYGRGHGTRETCALHTARLSCDTLMDFWSALGDETRASLLQMKEDDFIERLMYRFDSKRFCRDCRRNVIREFKELKELKRLRREPRCNVLFCGADTAFQYEVLETSIEADWQDFFTDGKYHHFEWGVGTSEGKSDICEFKNIGLITNISRTDLDLSQHNSLFIGLRAWRNDGKCNEYCVKAHAMKGQLCVHRRLIVGDGVVSITKGESMRRFFEHAEEAEEEDEEEAMERDGSDMDGEGSHPQKHAKSPELAREFLLDAATVIFKEQVEKAFREGTARQNAHSVFVSLALKLLEDRVHVACKEIITLEKQTMLLEEEEKEKREEEERKERRRNKEREKKLRRKERLKGKENREKETEQETESHTELELESKSPSEEFLPESPKSPKIPDYSRELELLPLERELELLLPLEFSEITSCTTEREEGESSQSNEVQYQYHQCQNEKEESFVLEQSKSSRRKLKYCNGNNDLGASEDCSTVVTKRNNRNCEMSYRSRDRYGSCGCGDRGQENSYHQTTYKPRQSYYRSIKYGNNNGYASESVPKGHNGAGTNGTVKTGSTTPKQVWEPLDSRKKINSTTNNTVANTNSTDFNANTTCEEVTDSCQKHENENVNEACSEECNGNLENEKMSQNTSNKDNNSCNGSPINHHTRDLDNCSSCLSEGDSSSSSISTGGPHNESSSSTSDSEDTSQQSEKGETIFQKDPPKESELQSCPSATNQSPHPVIKERENIVKSSPFHMTAVPVLVQTQPQPVHIPQYYPPSVGLGFHNQAVPVQTSWAGPTNGYPFAQQGHFSPYSNHHLGFGIPVHYNGPAVHHYPPLGLTHQQPLPVYKQHTLSRLNMDPIANRRVALLENPNPVRRSVPMAASPSSGNINDASSKKGEEKNGGLQSGKDDGSHFSLFHFGGPVGCRDHVKLDEESNRGVQCAREETLVKEYNLFSSSHSSFSFF